MNQKEITIALTHVPLFHNLDSRRLQSLAKRVVQREFPAGVNIVTQGDGGVGLFIITSGQAEAVRENADGSKTVVNTFGPNDYFGEMALLDEGSRTASVVTTAPTQCLVLASWDFTALLKSDVDMAIEILSEMAKRFRASLDAN